MDETDKSVIRKMFFSFPLKISNPPPKPDLPPTPRCIIEEGERDMALQVVEGEVAAAELPMLQLHRKMTTTKPFNGREEDDSSLALLSAVRVVVVPRSRSLCILQQQHKSVAKWLFSVFVGALFR